MRRSLCTALIFLLGATALAQDPKPTPVPDMAGAIGISVDNEPVVIIFVAKDGKAAIESVKDCVASPECMALFSKLNKEHKVDIINLHHAEGQYT